MQNYPDDYLPDNVAMIIEHPIRGRIIIHKDWDNKYIIHSRGIKEFMKEAKSHVATNQSASQSN
jgi:hypothetical protein